MNVTSIHFKIMYCLRRNVYSVSELAEILNISEFKVKRHIKDLEYLLEEESIENIHSKISQTPNIIEKMRRKQSFTPEERQMYIILKFLKLDIINLSLISEEIGITRRTLTNDLNDIKDNLEKFNLEIKNLARYGIFLEGKEVDKRSFFKLFLIKIFIEQKYLPPMFDKKFREFEILKKRYDVYTIIKRIFNLTDIRNNSFVFLNLEAISYISILRKYYNDETLDEVIENNDETNLKKLLEFLKETSIYSNFEINTIINLSKIRKKSNFLELNPEKKAEAEKLIEYMEKNLKREIRVTSELLERIMYITIVRDYKEKFNIDEFYIFNNAIGKAYMAPYKEIAELLKKYFGHLDSFDLANLTMTFLSMVYLDTKKNIENLIEIAVVYNFLHKKLVKDLCEDIGLRSDKNSYELVSIFDLEEFLKENNPKAVITFEDLDFSRYNVEDKLIEFNFPITKYDKLKLKPLIEEI
ncbi:helix-turn-helix domain-containing protein [Cetobacterium somerae]|uniref:helix-turn-helix domain-containing protein n=1 Tax=Cetobacterium somerae TaxID=188913 RepID=UPI003D767E4E